WSRTSKSNWRGSPQRCCSTLPVSSVPTGTPSCGRFGKPSAMASSSPRIASSRASLALSSSPRPATSASRGAASSPFALACPIALECVLRRFCSSWVRTWICLRSDSSADIATASSSKPRVSRRRRARSSGCWRSRAGSSMEGTSGDDQGIIARAASPRPDRRTIISNMHNGPGPDCLSAMPNPDAEPRRRTAVLPSPRALLLVVLAVALGAGAFALVWFNERDDYDFYRSSEGAPPTASPTSQQPLPAPSAGRRDGGLALPDAPGIAPVDATAGAEAEDAEAIAEVVVPPPPPP